MAKDTPSMAKNKIRRSLVAILNPHPSMPQVDALWSYFNHTCAYCGVAIERSSRTGHLDHVIPSALGGTNDIYNHVLACARCNGDERREGDWQNFVLQKAATTELAEIRSAKISAWLSKTTPRSSNSDVAQQAEEIIAEVLANYDDAVRRLRALRVGNDDHLR